MTLPASIPTSISTSMPNPAAAPCPPDPACPACRVAPRLHTADDPPDAAMPNRRTGRGALFPASRTRIRTAAAAAAAALIAVLSFAAAVAVAAEPPAGAAAEPAPLGLTPGAAPASAELIAELAEQDRRLFDAAFGCRLDALPAMFADDFEFIHDKWGRTATSGAQFVQSIRDGCARQAAGSDFRARREPVEGTLTVHVLTGYGALQQGEHRFYALRAGQPDTLTESGRFIHLWRRVDGVWKLARAISYDHRLAP